MSLFKSFLLVCLMLVSVGTSAQTESAKPLEVLATFDGGQITEDKVDAIAKNSLIKPLSQIYSIKLNVLQNLLADEVLLLESKALKTTPEALLDKNARSKVKEPTEAELKSFYESEKSNRMLQGKSFEESKDLIKKVFKNSKQDELSQVYIESLFKKYKVNINLDRPRSVVSVDNDPSMGPAEAPIVLIEFSDFQCPYCKKTRPAIDRLLKEYDGKIKYVFRDFPLSFHKQAADAAHAAECAGEQKKYWEYSKELWNKQNLIKDGFPILKSIAETTGLNMSAYQKCMDSKKYYAEIDKDQADGADAGVTGTPAYFINGIFLSGAQPYESFKEIVDEEIKRLGL